MFLDVPRCSLMFLDVPQCSSMFLDVPCTGPRRGRGVPGGPGGLLRQVLPAVHAQPAPQGACASRRSPRYVVTSALLLHAPPRNCGAATDAAAGGERHLEGA
eukprot:1903077-Pyramimonas_sp.AAC.1